MSRLQDWPVLLVEDDPADARSLTGVLVGEGAEVTWAKSVGEARSLGAQYRAAVVDLGLPDEPGLTLAQELRRDGLATVLVSKPANPGVFDMSVKLCRSSGFVLMHKTRDLPGLVAALLAASANE